MIVFAVQILTCVAVANCDWHTVDKVVSEKNCHDIGKVYMEDTAVQSYRCVIRMRDRR